MPTKLTPERAIIALNRIRNANDTRSDAVDMAIEAINRCMVARKPIYNEECKDETCPNCQTVLIANYCAKCGQKIDWGRDFDAMD